MNGNNPADYRPLEEKLDSFFSEYNGGNYGKSLLEEAMNVELPPDDDDWSDEGGVAEEKFLNVHKNKLATAESEEVRPVNNNNVEGVTSEPSTSQPPFCGAFQFLMLLVSYEDCMKNMDSDLRQRIEELVYHGREEKNTEHARYICNILNNENLRDRLIQELSPEARDEFFARLFEHYQH
uniref:Peroxin-19 n=1 Tax=Steinernema glaseri TaxID=37863 RepID=A0A1I7YBS0_9BILA